MSKHTRKSLVDVLNGGASREELARQFAEAEAAGDMLPLPRGTYRCRVADGELVTSKSGTPGYTLTFTVDDGEHKGRRLWHTSWLTEAAMPMTKRDLAKLGVTSLDMLDRPLPAGIVTDVKVALRVDDDGTERNRVMSFDVVEVLTDPTADDEFASPLPATTQEKA
ncbi:MAG: DUF669 domain-containing protein [Planctomycetota bacterium]